MSIERQSAEVFAHNPDSVQPRPAIGAGEQQVVAGEIDGGEPIAGTREPDMRRPRPRNAERRPRIGVNAGRGAIQVADLDLEILDEGLGLLTRLEPTCRACPVAPERLRIAVYAAGTESPGGLPISR